MFHKPRWSSGATSLACRSCQPLWQTLYENGAELVLVGHDHHYERFAPQNGAGDRTRATASASSSSARAALRTRPRHHGTQQRVPQQHRGRRIEAHAASVELRLAVPDDDRRHPRLRHERGSRRPKSAAGHRLRHDQRDHAEDVRHAHSDGHEPRPEQRPRHIRVPVAPKWQRHRRRDRNYAQPGGRRQRRPG